ncbi:putative Hemolysin [Roseovarius sp. EC-HK134]|jgi:magnesium and cobalt transporter|uniref:hemolysin family protein n=1 Tax=unclassified Roseovarius TaxID=2614913 RepID=UPI00015577E7|nr:MULTISPECIES: hemolysin family protein [unclassified Roseovarius]AWZ22502.1 Magnesium and cobalt efflux protein CorC [Roseovarius sp. AK1035]EDM32232.1 hemolysin, putative [Roseovarius sp. TM1035]VVT25233.1 putative Hemolysin [Roseovarius sp. EC-SD190]VVT33359.1 putative Hemolysin [Roseovarius sp. EC-HK134]
MGESIDGSSMAAQSAQPDDDKETEESGGFFRRILGVFSTTDEAEAAEDEHPAQANGVPGMGNLRHMAVEDVAIPKADIVSVPNSISKEDLVHVFRDSGMSRLPVYEGTLDSPIGMLHLKDFALKHGFNGETEEFKLEDMLRPLLFVPPSMPIGVLLQKMQAERRHMALVIDEYGGVDGLVTIEDLIEQVVGEIEDEHDIDEDHYWTQEKPGCYVALAKTPLEDFEAEIGISLTEADEVDEEEIDTLGGLVFMLLGRVPVRGEVIEHPAGPVIEVMEADPRRIKRVRVRLPEAKNA